MASSTLPYSHCGPTRRRPPTFPPSQAPRPLPAAVMDFRGRIPTLPPLENRIDRVGCRGLRPGTLPHHRTCGSRIRRLNTAAFYMVAARSDGIRGHPVNPRGAPVPDHGIPGVRGVGSCDHCFHQYLVHAFCPEFRDPSAKRPTRRGRRGYFRFSPPWSIRDGHRSCGVPSFPAPNSGPVIRFSLSCFLCSSVLRYSRLSAGIRRYYDLC